ncbi:MAG TPA: type VI secretion system-associated protein TagF [Burkholderiales bacterium]|nr:type VI secretion system-associated protein TagF [Burkholderiales bacterium]
MMAAGSATEESFSAGWYGKIPGTGDFITRRMPPAFSESWDRWLQAAIAGSRDRLGGRWRDTFLSMPIWRFVLSPGMLTPNAWAGIMAPSVDAVGRYFPLAVASALPSASLDVVGTLMAAEPWFDEIETIALSAIAPAADSAVIDAAIVQKPFRTEWLRFPEGRDDTVPIRSAKPQMLWLPLGARTAAPAPREVLDLAARLAEPTAAWLAEESEMFGRCALLCEALPPAEQYCAMMDGRWVERGWGRRDVRSSAPA